MDVEYILSYHIILRLHRIPVPPVPSLAFHGDRQRKQLRAQLEPWQGYIPVLAPGHVSTARALLVVDSMGLYYPIHWRHLAIIGMPKLGNPGYANTLACAELVAGCQFVTCI